jgi:hypothetical protein
MYGVTSLAFFSHREKFSPQHLELARRVFGGFKRGSYVVLDTSDIDVLGLAFGERGQLHTHIFSGARFDRRQRKPSFRRKLRP